MTVSFVINKAPIFRTFTIEESKAIYNIEIDENCVEIIYHSNTEKAHAFNATSRFAAHLTEIIKSPDLLGFSLGKVIDKAKKIEDLQRIEFTED